jgi:hypothetical protein
LQVQQNTVPIFRESAVSAANGEFCKFLYRFDGGISRKVLENYF